VEHRNKVNLSVWVVVVCTALSGFFALASYSLRFYRRAQMEEALGDTDAGRDRLQLIERNLTSLRLTASFYRALINAVLVVAMLYALASPGRTAGGFAIAAAAVAASMAVIGIFGVAIPHAWASYAGEKVVFALYRPIMACHYALYPVLILMQALDLPVRRLCGVQENAPDNGDAKQEILQAASEGQVEGTVDAEEAEMIESVIEFGDTHAGEIMTPRTDIFALPVDTPWLEACKQVTTAGHTRVPLYEGDLDNIVGVLYAKDLLKYTNDEKPQTLRETMRKPFFIPESKPLDDLLREFKARKVHMAIVLDEYGGTAGLVTIEDVIEEIVGDITDEYDRAEPIVMRRIDENTAEVDGRMYVDDLNDALELNLPEDEDYDTVAGLVFSRLGYIPTPGETLQVDGAEFTVLAADERRITKLKVSKVQRQPTE